MPYAKKTRKLLKTRKIYRRKRAAPNKKRIRQIVKREIARNNENKITELKLENTGIFNYIDSGAFKSLMPVIPQGTGQAERVGNRLKLKKVIMRINLFMIYPATNADIPKYVDFYIVKYKYSNSQVSIADAARFLQNGNSSSQYLGQSFDGLRSVNADLFSLKKKYRFRMINSYTTNNPAGLDKYDSMKSFSINLTRFYKKILNFNDTINTPQNDNLFLAIATTDYYQVGIPSSNNTGQFSFVTTFEYEDS